MRKLGIAGQFDYIADSSRIARAKPDPEIFLTVARELGVSPELCIGVEDAAAGIVAIHAAGMPAIGIGDSHVLGQADYTDDIDEVRGTLHAALGLSSKPHAKILSIDLAEVRASRGVVAVYTARDIPGTNDCGPIIHDDPILADGLVQYVGQPVFVVVADSHDNARRAARKGVVTYEELPAILTPQAQQRIRTFLRR